MLKPFCQVTGNGPALVLLHGWGLHGGIWETILPKLNQDFTVYTIDLPGFGRSPIANTDYTLDYLVESVNSVVPDSDSFYLLGWSLGGLVAKAFSLQYPEKIKKLITVASSPCFVASDNWQHAMPIHILESFIGYLKDDYEGTLIRFLAIQTMGSETQKDDINQLKETVFIHGQPAPKALSGGLEILQQTNLLSELSQLTMPFLRIYGRLDSLVPVGVCENLEQQLPNSQSLIYKKAAHAPFLSSSDEFCIDIKKFLLAGE
jgi:pimeloyl-[acyl-carrier protein] methyl ester esterase